jgi:S1-C subfamily serine protease
VIGRDVSALVVLAVALALIVATIGYVMSGPSLPVVPLPSSPATRPPQAGSLDTVAIASRVLPGPIDVNVTLGYQNRKAAGTSMVVTPSGDVPTNNHVIAGARRSAWSTWGTARPIRQLSSATTSQTTSLCGTSRGASALPTVTIGDSSTAAVGDLVVGMGNAGGISGTPGAASGR